MPVKSRWIEPGRVLAIEVTDATDPRIGETLRLEGKVLHAPRALRDLVARMVAESCARTGAKP